MQVTLFVSTHVATQGNKFIISFLPSSTLLEKETVNLGSIHKNLCNISDVAKVSKLLGASWILHIIWE